MSKFTLYLFILALAGAGWLWSQRVQLQERIVRLDRDLAAERASVAALSDSVMRSRQEVTLLTEQLERVAAARNDAHQRQQELESRYEQAQRQLSQIYERPAAAHWLDQPVPDDLAEWLHQLPASRTRRH